MYPGVGVARGAGAGRELPYEKVGDSRRLAQGFKSRILASVRVAAIFSCQSIFKGALEEIIKKPFYFRF